METYLLAFKEQALVSLLVANEADLLGLDCDRISRSVLKLLIWPSEE